MSEHLQPTALTGFDSLDTAARCDALAHVESCVACREAWLARDPLRAFALLSRAEVPAGRLDELSARVSVAVEELAVAPARHRTFGAVAIAASMLLAAVVGAVLWKHEMPEPLPAISEIGFLQPLEDEVAGMYLLDSVGGDAQELKLTIGETQVLMIFDESIEL